MRLAELDLLAYGKFTDEKLLFPQGPHDFHVIIGPNEAGKSTVRRAITELLFGMEVRSPLGFKHAQSDLRIAGVLESGTASFPFMRTKQQKSLRSMAGEVLQDSDLAAVLGLLKQDTFEELHCLDHGRLVKGGQGIVDPKNSVSQILFQAASGLEDFTAVREALGERAAGLFARAGRNNQFARSAEKLALAQKTLKEAQVRTRAWVEAREALQAADDALAAERQHRRDLELQAMRWERARRVGPLVESLARLQHEVATLGDVVAFAPGTKDTLATGIARIDAAAARVRTREDDLLRAQAALDAITTDDAVLGEAAAIARLGALCGLHPNHARDLPVRRAEVEGWLAEVVQRSAQFGWGATEADVRARLPQDKVVRAIDALLKTRGGLLAEARAATETLAEREAAVADLAQRLQASADHALDPQLVEALERALPFKTSEPRQQALASALHAAQAAAGNALAALGRPDLTQDGLRAMRLPSAERVTTYRATRQDIVQAAAMAGSHLAQSEATVAALELTRAQFERSHQVVTLAEVAAARRERDGHWSGIKGGSITLADGAPQLDGAIRLADELADSRTRSEADAAELQALRDQVERATAERARHAADVAQQGRALADFDARWAGTASAMGLPGMELDDLQEWLARREAALQALDAAALKQHERDTERDGAGQARSGLAQAMAAAGLAVTAGHGLAALCAQAQAHLQGIRVGLTRRSDLQQQMQAAEGAARMAGRTLATRQAAVEAWTAQWDALLGRANLSGVAGDVAEVESAMLAWEFIRQRLERVDTTRAERIETMEADLQRMRDAAQAVRHLSPELAHGSPEQVFATLDARLAGARQQADRKAQAEKHLDDARRQRDQAASELAEATRALQPLLAIAGVDEPMLALPLVERWQARTDLLAAIADTRKRLDEASDGLALAEVEAEVASHPAAQAAEEVARLRDALADAEGRLTTLVAAQVRARQDFDLIDGSDKAAVAEAQRHEALAEIADVSEEYLQLATAGSLLKWAVDRYRDRKQGPLLERASGVFRKLTHDAFEKLRVDFEQVPPALVAYRQNNQQVKVAGLSDGTRDQLFLALRIAALELQSEQSAPVPFIADDLFINFDDRRSQAGLLALHALSAKTQVVFLSHQEHLLPVIRALLPQVNVIVLRAEEAVAAG